MSRNWKRSGLTIGTPLTIPVDLFIEPTKALDRLESVTYVGENSAGIMVDCKFLPAFNTINPEGSHYRMFLNWASIWCGQLHVLKEDGTMLRAEREDGVPTVQSVLEAD